MYTRTQSINNHSYSFFTDFFISFFFFFLVPKWMVIGQVGHLGAAVLLVFAREIRKFEQELALIHSQVMMDSSAREKVLRGWIA